ncbi:MAG TPA: YDG domain-containing protein, partial [Paludibacter sp.]|nr:YDG domain-containing protein [Paludibacter sp.]
VTAVTDTKTYDGNTTSSGAPVVGTLATGDAVNAAPTQTYDDKNYGLTHILTPTGLTVKDGANADMTGNYTISYNASPETGIINKLDITANFTVNPTKIYDGNVVASIITRNFISIIPSDDVNLIGTANYNNKNIGTGKLVTLTNYSLSGIDSGNYNLTSVATTTADITKRTLNLSNFGADSKYYDGTTVATGIGFNDDRTLGDNLAFGRTAEFENASVGTNKNVNYSNISISGGLDKDNYVLASTVGVAKADIWIKPITVSITAANKVYDGNNTASVLLSGAFAPGDDVSVSYASATFDYKNIGPAKTVTIIGMALIGNDAAKYSLVSTSGITTANITAKELVVNNAIAANKTYDGTKSAIISGATLMGVVNNENVILVNATTGTFAQASVGSSISVASDMNITGSDVANYTLTQPVLQASITAKDLTASDPTLTTSKVYDATTAAAVSVGTLSGVETADIVTVNATANYNSAVVGVNKTITTVYSLFGSAASNYTAPANYITNNSTITAKALSVDGAIAANKVYDGTTATTISGATLVGVVSGDNVTLGTLVGSFAQKNVGNNISITTGLTLTGASSGNYTVNQPTNVTANITSKQLTISTPSVVINKMYDGNTNAVVSSVGTLNGVTQSDASSVIATATASYSTMTIGNNKTITVVYTLSGSNAENYIVPENYIISAGKISGSITLSPLANPSAGCVGSDLVLSYNVLTGTPTQYKFTFDANAITAGIENVDYTGSGLDLIGQLPISIPVKTASGTYTGTLQMRNELGIESPAYSFQFSINISSDSIYTKFDDVVLVSNRDNKFISYQWYKNGVAIDKATKQYYADPEGLNGEYSVKVKSVDGKEFSTCPKALHIPLRTSVTVYPNPIKVGQVCTVKVTGFNKSELDNSVMSVYDAQGKCVYVTSKVDVFNTIPLPETSGVYVGHITATGGKEYSFKVVVLIK